MGRSLRACIKCLWASITVSQGSKQRSLLLLTAALLIVIFDSTRALGQSATSPFIIKPYLQLGLESKQKEDHGYSLVWFTQEADNGNNVFKVTYKSESDKKARQAASITERLINVPTVRAVCRHTARLDDIKAGESFSYSVEYAGKVVFSATGKARTNKEQATRFAVFGDCGADTHGQRLVAKQCFKQKPDLLVIPGDVVYQHGLYSEYLSNFFPIYNGDKESDSSVPLMRSIPIAAVLGNHDIALSGRGCDLDRFPEAMAYFFFWQSPLNGFGTTSGDSFPTLKGSIARQEMLKKSAGDSFPTMANYSFDFGNSHWTVLDGNYYMNWSDVKIREWLEKDLKSVPEGKWKFVTFHQPAFSIDAPHGKEQRMRLVTDILQKYKVDLVLAGHSHCYERTRPITFVPNDVTQMFKANADGTVHGDIQLDLQYDGKKRTQPKGIIHIVTGAGGARLYPIDNSYKPERGHDWMLKYNSSVHSFTSMDLDGKTLKVKQIDQSGKVLDEFVITK